MMTHTANTPLCLRTLALAKHGFIALFLLCSLAFAHDASAQEDNFTYISPDMVMFPGEVLVQKITYYPSGGVLSCFTPEVRVGTATLTLTQPSSPWLNLSSLVVQSICRVSTCNTFGTFTVTYTAPESPGLYEEYVPYTESSSVLEQCRLEDKYYFGIVMPDSAGYYYFRGEKYRIGAFSGSSANTCEVVAKDSCDLPIERIRFPGGVDPFACDDLPPATTYTHAAIVFPEVRALLDGKEPMVFSTPTYNVDNGSTIEDQGGVADFDMRRTVQAPRIGNWPPITQYSVFERIRVDGNNWLRTMFYYKRWDITVKDTSNIAFYHQVTDPNQNEALRKVTFLTSSEQRYDFFSDRSIVGYTPIGEVDENFLYPSPAKICADSSNSTLISFRDPVNKRGQMVRFQIEEKGSTYEGLYGYPSSYSIYWDGQTYDPKYGKLETILQSPDSLVVRYTHPSYKSVNNMDAHLTIRVIYKDDTGENDEKYVINWHPIYLAPTPVVMMHGLWDNASCWKDLEKELVANKSFPAVLLSRIDYTNTNDAALTVNITQNTIIKGGDNKQGIDAALRKAVDAKFSTGKVSLVGHSMGGLLSRLYIQSTPGGEPYRNDVDRLITVNTPHLGSQIGDNYYNAIVNNDQITIAQMRLAGYIIDHDIVTPATYGAVRDLGTESYATRTILNNNGDCSERLNRVWSHSVITTADPEQFNDDAFNANNPGFAYWRPGGVLTPIIGLIGRPVASWLFIPNQFPSIFNCEESDLTVPFSSQRGSSRIIPSGGSQLLYSNSWPAKNQLHASSPRNRDVIENIVTLLLQDPTRKDMTSGFDIGFCPGAPPEVADPTNSPFLYYDTAFYAKPCPRSEPKAIPSATNTQISVLSHAITSADAKKLSGEAHINSPNDGQTLQSGGMTTVQFTQSGAVAYQVISASFPNVPPVMDSLRAVAAVDTIGNKTLFNLMIPREAAGVGKFTLTALDVNGAILSVDSVKINIDVPSPMTELISPNSQLYVPRGDTALLRLEGRYLDSIERDITGISGLTLNSDNVSVVEVLSNQKFVARSVGTAKLIARYKGYESTTVVQVYPFTPSTTSSIGGNGDDGTTPKSDNAVKSYSLSQNYPNPFNPATRISFSLPSAGLVKLKVYDVLGRVVKVLVDEKRDMGRYEVSFDGSKLASGVYFYRLEVRSSGSLSGNFTQSKKMILVK